MEVLDKNVIKEKYGLLKDSIVNEVSYLDGLPQIKPGEVVSLNIYENGVVFKISALFQKSKLYGMTKDELEAVEFEAWDVVKEKERSVIGRAVVGSLIGPVGAIVGGLSGLKNKKIYPDYALAFADKNGDKVVFSVKSKDVEKVSKIIRRNFATLLV